MVIHTIPSKKRRKKKYGAGRRRVGEAPELSCFTSFHQTKTHSIYSTSYLVQEVIIVPPGNGELKLLY